MADAFRHPRLSSGPILSHMALDIRRTATIEDVAAAAGVSRAAVSKVLRGAYGVSDAMRERVTAAMTELDYRPRIAARAMRGRTFTIGIEIPDFGNQFFTRMLHGVMHELSGTDYQVVIAPAEEGSREGRRAIEALVDRQVDGVITVAPPVGQSALERLATSTPIVMFGRHDRSDAYDTVVGDDALGARRAVEHLIGLGHRRIAHLTLLESHEDDRSPHGIRLATYRAVMAEHGRGDDIVVLRSDEGQDAASEATRAALAHDPSITAVFAAHDELAIGALGAIVSHEAPVAVVGYDDVPIAGHPAIGLTTMRQPGDAMGARAIELLLERIAGRQEAVQVTYEAELVIRASTFPPRS